MSGEEFYALSVVEQRLQVAAWETKRDACSEHGGPRSECEDAATKWFPQRTVCHATMERAAAEWGYDQCHDAEPFHDGTFTKWAATRSLLHPYHYRDGVRLWVAPVDLNPHDHFLGGVEECEVCTPPD